MSFIKSKRKQKLWISVGGTLLGVILTSWFAVWLQGRRETDFANPTENVTSRFKVTESGRPSPIRFEEVATRLGIVMRHGPGPRGRTLPEDTGSGIAWGDYDGDGDWDLYVVSFPGPLGEPPDPAGSNRLFRNDGDRFTDVTEQAGVGDLEGFGMGASFVDYDNDGDADIYVTNFGPNRLFRNNGDGTFDDVAEAAGVADPLWSTGMAWGDFNRDGHIDLYVCNYIDYGNAGQGPSLQLPSAAGTYEVPFTLNPNSFDPQPNRLYQNRGDGTFEEVAELRGVINRDGRSLGVTFCDLDDDGWLDLYVNNDASPNKLYRNMGPDPADHPIPFEDISNLTGTADPRGSMGLSVGEIGGMDGEPDGIPDLFISHWIAQENAFYQSMRNAQGRLEYRDKTRQFRLGEISIDTVGWGTALVDFDLDGGLDLAVANGSTLEWPHNPLDLRAEPLFLFWNTGGSFQNVAPQAGPGLTNTYWARGLAAADFDRDGDIDLAIAINRGQPLLLRNTTATTHQSLAIRLSGSSAVCFGSKVEVRQGSGRQIQWYGGDVSYLGMHAPELIFGLGTSGPVEQVWVRWADGVSSIATNVHPPRLTLTHPGPSGS